MRLGTPPTWLVRTARATAIVLAAVLLYCAGRQQREQTPPAVALEQAQRVFPTVHRVGRFDESHGAWPVYGERGAPLGYVLTTSPAADDLIGYSGPSNLIVGLTLDRRIQAVALLSSRDTPAHVAQVRDDARFWRQFEGRPADADPEANAEPIEAVSGSTLTSLAMAEGVERNVSGKSVSFRFPAPLTLAEVQDVFPSATALQVDAPRRGWIGVSGEGGELLGYAVRTSPQADNVIGYAGPTESWAAVDRQRQTVVAVRLRKSYDTPEYVDRVRQDERYLEQLAGRSPEEWVRIDFQREGIEGVSGATQTSYAIAEGLRRRFAADAEKPAATEEAMWRPGIRDVALGFIILGALVMSFSRLKSSRRLRILWQIVLVAGFGLWLGDLLSLALVTGWAKGGAPWRTAPGLVALLAVALLAPWATRRQVYCRQICPHGAVQEWLGRFRRLHWKTPPRLARVLRAAPFALLAVAFVLAVVAPRFDLSLLEPFDAWALWSAALIPVVFIPTCLAVLSLAFSLFVPMGYCRFGCPTGALLKMVQTHAGERFRWRDAAALGLLLFAAAYVFLPPVLPASLFMASSDEAAPPPGASREFSGRAFGTTWSVKLRTPAARSLQHVIDEELERIESSFSHWREESETSQFNSSRTTLAMEMSPECLALVSFGRRLSEATDGAFDPTVAPLVDAWGFGPSGPRKQPTDDEIAALLAQTGWRKLTIDEKDGTLQKTNPRLKIDLGALLQGYAADRIGGRLEARGIEQYLVEVGGELKARGSWKVAIENPADAARPLRTVLLRDSALATSGVYRNAGHILDPHTGRPAEARWRLVAVIRPTCLEADGWATALLAASERAPAVAERERIAALLLGADGAIETSPAGSAAFAPAAP